MVHSMCRNANAAITYYGPFHVTYFHFTRYTHLCIAGPALRNMPWTFFHLLYGIICKPCIMIVKTAAAGSTIVKT